MKKLKRNKLILIITLVILVIAAFWFTFANQNNCDAIACASGDNCVAPNDAIVKCEDLRKNPTKTDWY